MFEKLFNKKLPAERDDTGKMGICPICSDIINNMPTFIDKNNEIVKIKQEPERMFNLCGIEVCEGCYHDLINHMSYKNIDDLLPCDKKQLNKFLNMVATKLTPSKE